MIKKKNSPKTPTKELRPIDLQLGNFIENMGTVEMVTGLVPQERGSWFICHKAWNVDGNPIPDGIQYDAYPILLTDEWKECLGIDKYENIPKWIQYVHEAQNWFMWHLRVNLLETINWGKLPEKI